jgi:hypothetical protein
LLKKTFSFYFLSDWKGADATRSSRLAAESKLTGIIQLKFYEEKEGE